MITTRTLRAAVGLGLLALVACEPAGRESAQAAQTTQGQVVRDRRFSGYVRLQSSRGPDSVRVEITNIDIRGGQAIDRLELPFEGTAMAYLQAGELTTTIAGRREERRQGQIWTVPPGVAMGLATGRDAASLQIVVVAR